MKRKAYSIRRSDHRAKTSAVSSRSVHVRGGTAKAGRKDFDRSLKRSIDRNRDVLIALAES